MFTKPLVGEKDDDRRDSALQNEKHEMVSEENRKVASRCDSLVLDQVDRSR